MFAPDPGRHFIDVDPPSIAALYHSVNQTSVLLPGAASTMARAVVVGHRVGSGYDVVIGLHLVESGQHLVFSHDGAGLLDGEGARDTAREALAFVESMGFFMENVNWKQLGDDERAQLVGQLKVFAPPPEKQAPERRPVDPRLALARLLVQF